MRDSEYSIRFSLFEVKLSNQIHLDHNARCTTSNNVVTNIYKFILLLDP